MAWPWYWRLTTIILLSALSIALAGWIYDAGRSFSGLSIGESEQELTSLRDRVGVLERELSEARALANTGESKLQIEKTTQDQLMQQVRKVEDDNVRLKSDLAMFENFLGNDSGLAGLSISRFRVEPYGEAGKYAYHLLITQQGKDRGREFKGRLQLAILARQGSQPVMIDYPDKDETDLAKFLVNFKYFARIDGNFRIPANTTLISIEVQVIESGTIRARHSVKF